MLSVNEMLDVALALSVLSYYAGLVLFAAPLPASLKRFGLRMAYHGAVSALLASLYTTIVYGVEVLLDNIGFSWSTLPAFYDKAAVHSAEFYAAAAVLAGLRPSVIKALPPEFRAGVDFVIRSAASNLLRASTLIGFSLAAVEVVASFVYRYWTLLVLLGIVLYALPGGIGRRAGASLIASGVVLYVALPLLPAWVDLWLNSVVNANPAAALIVAGASKPTLYLLWGHVRGALDIEHPLTVVLWRGGVPVASQTSTGVYWFPELLAPGPVRLQVVSGRVTLLDTVRVVPDDCEFRPAPRIDIFTLAYVFLSQVFRADIKQCMIDLFAENAYAFYDHILIVNEDAGFFVDKFEDKSGNYSVVLSGYKRGTLYIYTCCKCNANITSSNVELVKVGENAWRAVMLTDNATLEIRVWGCEGGFSSETSFKPNPLNGVLSLILHDIPLSAYMVALAYTMGVWSFYALLATSIYGFSRVMGESGTLVFRLRY